MATQITTTRDPDYVDLDLDFLKSSKTDKLILKTGVDAIKRSIRNLLLTNRYERPFQPQIGSGIRELLFENYTPIVYTLLKDEISYTLNKYEPRVAIQGIIIDEDIDNNGISVTLNFIIKNTNEPVTMAVFLERIR